MANHPIKQWDKRFIPAPKRAAGQAWTAPKTPGGVDTPPAQRLGALQHARTLRRRVGRYGAAWP